MTIPANVTSAGICSVLGSLNAGTAFSGITALVGSITGTIGAIGSAASALLALPGQVAGILLADVQVLANAITAAATGAFNNLVGHALGAATSLVNDLSMAIGQASAQAGLTNAGCALPSLGSGPQSGECGNISTLFGSITGLGATIMSAATGALGLVTAQISGLVSGAITGITAAMTAMTNAVASITAAASQVVSMIASEVAAKVSMLADMITFGAASALQNLFKHPCAGPVLSSVGSPALLAALRG